MHCEGEQAEHLSAGGSDARRADEQAIRAVGDELDQPVVACCVDPPASGATYAAGPMAMAATENAFGRRVGPKKRYDESAVPWVNFLDPGRTAGRHRGPPMSAPSTSDPALTGVGEPSGLRWKRRAVSVPAMLLITAVTFTVAPILALGLVAADLVVGRIRLPRLRLFGVALQYLFNDTVEILFAPVLWVVAGFGTRVDSRASQRRHARLQRWSIDVLARRAERLLGLRIELEGAEALRPAPAIVLSRHVSIADGSLPVLLYGPEIGYDARGVIMAEMLSDPGFDLLYGRLGSVFINRDRGQEAQLVIRRLGEGLDDRSVAVICPEGRLFRPDALERALARLERNDPVRAERLSGLRHVLPPRPGGVLSLLDGAPTADVVIVAHAGFESVPSIAELARRAPLDRAIEVAVRRVPRPLIPDDPDGRVKWLDEEWLRLDAWVDGRTRAQPQVGIDV